MYTCCGVVAIVFFLIFLLRQQLDIAVTLVLHEALLALTHIQCAYEYKLCDRRVHDTDILDR